MFGEDHLRFVRGHTTQRCLFLVSSVNARASKSEGGVNGSQTLLKEAFNYLNTVKDTFADNTQTYQEFTSLLKDFNEKRFAIGVQSRDG